MINCIAVIIMSLMSLGMLVWPNTGFAQGTIYKWIDSKGSVHYSNTPTGEARSIDDELPPATSFGSQTDTASTVAAEAPPTPQTQVAEADAIEGETYAEETFEQTEGEAAYDETDDAEAVEDFALGQDGPFGALEGALSDD